METASGGKRCAHLTKVEQEQAIQSVLVAFRDSINQSWEGVALPIHVNRSLKCIHMYLFEEELNVAFVRSWCGLRNHNISMHFKRVIGISMHDYIEKQRMEAAMQLLQHKALGIQQIGWAVGYTDPETFDRAFKRYAGCTPTQFRNQPQDEKSRPKINSLNPA